MHSIQYGNQTFAWTNDYEAITALDIVAGVTETKMPEEKEEDLWLPMAMSDIAHIRSEANTAFLHATGMNLPAIPEFAEMASVIRPCIWIPQGIPEGPLLYPCCGSDTEDAISKFGPSVSACHFADPYNPPMGKRPGEYLRPTEIPFIGNIVLGDGKSWRVESDVYPCPVVIHQKDGLLTLLQDIDHLAVFYYRGDSHGEGGSDQCWLFPVLFEVVISKLLEGGVVCTDGSNSNCWSEALNNYSPFVALGGSQPYFLPKRKIGDRIGYGPRILECIGEMEGRHEGSRMLVWRVTSQRLASEAVSIEP